MHLVRGDSREASEDAARFVAAILQEPLRRLAKEYVQQCRYWALEQPASAGKAEPKDYQARHAALKTALGHIELLLKLSRGLEADAGAGAEDEAALEAEAARNLARPA